MKRILIGLLFVMFSAMCFPAEYAYKMVNGKFGKLDKIEASQADDYRADGFTVTSDVVAVYDMAVSFGQEQSAKVKGIVPTAQDRILKETTFGKLEITEVLDEQVIVQAVPATETTPEVKQVTLRDILDQVLKSNPKFEQYWNDADKGIDLTYPKVVEALAQFPVALDIPALKLAILAKRQQKASK